MYWIVDGRIVLSLKPPGYFAKHPGTAEAYTHLEVAGAG